MNDSFLDRTEEPQPWKLSWFRVLVALVAIALVIGLFIARTWPKLVSHHDVRSIMDALSVLTKFAAFTYLFASGLTKWVRYLPVDWHYREAHIKVLATPGLIVAAEVWIFLSPNVAPWFKGNVIWVGAVLFGALAWATGLAHMLQLGKALEMMRRLLLGLAAMACIAIPCAPDFAHKEWLFFPALVAAFVECVSEPTFWAPKLFPDRRHNVIGARISAVVGAVWTIFALIAPGTDGYQFVQLMSVLILVATWFVIFCMHYDSARIKATIEA